MKVCANCGSENVGGDKENLCELCYMAENKAALKRRRAMLYRRERDQAMRDLGLVRVRGALGGVYWE